MLDIRPFVIILYIFIMLTWVKLLPKLLVILHKKLIDYLLIAFGVLIEASYPKSFLPLLRGAGDDDKGNPLFL